MGATTSGQHVLLKIINHISQLYQTNWHLRLQWLPDHAGIKGNKLTDQATKKAAILAPTWLVLPEPHPFFWGETLPT